MRDLVTKANNPQRQLMALVRYYGFCQAEYNLEQDPKMFEHHQERIMKVMRDIKDMVVRYVPNKQD